jgi:hypothetical protein
MKKLYSFFAQVLSRLTEWGTLELQLPKYFLAGLLMFGDGMQHFIYAGVLMLLLCNYKQEKREYE